MIQLKEAQTFFSLIDMREAFDKFIVGKGLSMEQGVEWIPIRDVQDFIKQTK